MCASDYERCPLTGIAKCRVLVEKLSRPQFGVRLTEVSVCGAWFDCIYIYI